MASWDVNGKTCLVTGATNGIGKVTAQALAARGASVVLVGRNAARTQEAVEEIRKATNNQRVESMLADLSSQAEVRRLAAEFKTRYDQLHVLVNNAGAVFTERQTTVDGIEMTFALNHLAYFLLTNLLLDTIKASAPARIINVSSEAHMSGKIEFDKANVFTTASAHTPAPSWQTCCSRLNWRGACRGRVSRRTCCIRGSSIPDSGITARACSCACSLR
jgi:NAD(P)-dependent dehydrogenase (short-subunit alcohol dehydrogenase family)